MQCHVDILHGTRGKTSIALAPVKPPYMGGGKRLQFYVSQSWDDMVAHEVFVVSIGYIPNAALNRVLQPALQILIKLQVLRVESEATLSIRQRLGQLRRHLLSGLAVDGLSLAPLTRVDGVLCAPASVLAPVNTSLAIASLTHCGFPCVRVPSALLPKPQQVCGWF